jgi:hypothetical protein
LMPPPMTSRSTMARDYRPSAHPPYRLLPGLAAARLFQLIELEDLDANLAVIRAGFTFGLRLLAYLGLLLPPNALEGLAHVGIEARLVSKRGIEDMFHARLSYADVEIVSAHDRQRWWSI